MLDIFSFIVYFENSIFRQYIIIIYINFIDIVYKQKKILLLENKQNLVEIETIIEILKIFRDIKNSKIYISINNIVVIIDYLLFSLFSRYFSFCLQYCYSQFLYYLSILLYCRLRFVYYLSSLSSLLFCIVFYSMLKYDSRYLFCSNSKTLWTFLYCCFRYWSLYYRRFKT